MCKQLIEAPPLSWVLDEALSDKVGKLVGPFRGNPWHLLIDDLVEQSIDVLSVGTMWWLACSKLECEAAKGPHVNFL